MGIEDPTLNMDSLVKAIIILRTTPDNFHTTMHSQNHSKKYINKASTSTINPRGCLDAHCNQVIQKNHIYDKHNNEILTKRVEFRDKNK